MGSTRFRNPRALSSALASLGTLQPWALRFLNHVDPLVSAFNYYIGSYEGVTLEAWNTTRQGLIVRLSPAQRNGLPLLTAPQLCDRVWLWSTLCCRLGHCSWCCRLGALPRGAAGLEHCSRCCRGVLLVVLPAWGIASWCCRLGALPRGAAGLEHPLLQYTYVCIWEGGGGSCI